MTKPKTLGEKCAELERRIEDLERLAYPWGAPSMPALPPNIKPALHPLRCFDIGKCPRCGIELMPIMCYTCSQSDCPCGLGGFSSGVGS